MPHDIKYRNIALFILKRYLIILRAFQVTMLCIIYQTAVTYLTYLRYLIYITSNIWINFCHTSKNGFTSQQEGPGLNPWLIRASFCVCMFFSHLWVSSRYSGFFLHSKHIVEVTGYSALPIAAAVVPLQAWIYWEGCIRKDIWRKTNLPIWQADDGCPVTVTPNRNSQKKQLESDQTFQMFLHLFSNSEQISNQIKLLLINPLIIEQLVIKIS